MSGDVRKILSELRSLEQTRLHHDNASELYDWVAEASRSIGMEHPPEIIQIKHDVPAAYSAFVNADSTAKALGHKQMPTIYITEGMMEKVFGSPNLHEYAPDGLKGIIGHEMSHLADGKNAMSMTHLPIFAIPILSLVGYELYKEAKRRNNSDPLMTIGEHLDTVTNDTKKHNALEGQALEWAKRLAVVGGGLVAGAMISRHLSIASEFKADKIGVLASGHPESFVDVLNKLGLSTEEALNKKHGKWSDGVSSRSFSDNIKNVFSSLKDSFAKLTYDAHPSDAKRIESARQFGKDVGMLSH